MGEFDQLISRRGTYFIKWHVKDGELPMWIADMDFKTAPAILKAMREKVDFGVFGYEEPQSDYFNAVAHWYETEHHARPETDWMLYCTGVVPAISSVVQRISHVGDNVVVQAPVYDIFYHSIENNGRHVLSSDLIYDQQEHRYLIDFTDLEAKLAEPLTTLMILCNPHNPVGKVWSRDELIQISRLCQKHHVVLLSDEIHGDLVFGEPAYTPLFSLPEELIQNTITTVSPSKSFNVAALHAATVIVPNENLRESVSRGINNDELGEPNLLAIPATIAAYTQSADWLHALKAKLVENRKIVDRFVSTELTEVQLVSENATYLLWFDVSQVTDDAEKLTAFIRKQTGLFLSAGTVYRGNGHDFLRMNIACPTELVEDGLHRLKQGITEFEKLN
ncbi:MAG: pyridoxal phosphate-dependent aminotransferase [Pediococcus sp.]|nr:pyridoxal phosphate-dependent aminotransferase [Pediococcus sp.]